MMKLNVAVGPNEMKRLTYVLALLLVVALAAVISHKIGVRAGQRSARIEELTRHACHIACDLGRLRRSQYSDTNHLHIMELSLNAELSQLAALTSYKNIHPVHRNMLAIVAGYRQNHPFVLNASAPDPSIKTSSVLARYHEEAFTKARDFLAEVTSTQDHLYRDERKERSNKMPRHVP